MSHKMPSTEIDKQLQDTFSVYVVDPMHKDIEGQLANLQKKWLGNPNFEDEDTPYLEIFMDDRLASIKSKLAKHQDAIDKQFTSLTSILETISDNTDQIDQVAGTTASVDKTMQSVQEDLRAINSSLTALDGDAKQTTADLKANSESILNAISTSDKNNHAFMNTAADELKLVLSHAVDTLSYDAEQNKADLKANAATETNKVLEAISVSEENHKAAADGLEQALAQAVDTLSRGAEQEKADLKANTATEINKVLETISISEKNSTAAAQTAANKLEQALTQAVDTLSRGAEQDSTELKANAAKETKKVLDAISISEKNSTTAAQTASDKLKQALSDAVDSLSHRVEQDYTAQQERLEGLSTQVGTLATQLDTAQKKLHNILYLSLALNGATLLGLVVALLMLFLGT